MNEYDETDRRFKINGYKLYFKYDKEDYKYYLCNKMYGQECRGSIKNIAHSPDQNVWTHMSMLYQIKYQKVIP